MSSSRGQTRGLYEGPVGLPPNDAKTGPRGEPMTPIPSATLVVLCPTGGGVAASTSSQAGRDNYATLVVQRSARQGGSFRSAVVFPGGLLDLADEHAVQQQQLTSAWQAARGGGNNTKVSSRDMVDPDAGLDLYLQSLQLCALRETFEETGLLLVPAADDGSARAACSRAVGHVEAGVSAEAWKALRDEVHDDARAFVPLLARITRHLKTQQHGGSNVCEHADSPSSSSAPVLPLLAPLRHHSNWVTPRNMARPAKRFDTHFFITVLDEVDALGPLTSAAKQSEQTSTGLGGSVRDVSSITADGSETTNVRLATPLELMDLAVKDSIVLYPPQYYVSTVLQCVCEIGFPFD